MADITTIKNDELEPGEKTGGDFFDNEKKGTSSGTESTDTDSKIYNETEENFADRGRNPTPFEISRMKYYDSQKKKSEAITAVFKVLKYLIPTFISIVTILMAFFGGVWAYKLNNIAEPIGGLKVEAQYLKDDISELKSDVKKLQEKLNNTKQVGQ